MLARGGTGIEFCTDATAHAAVQTIQVPPGNSTRAQIRQGQLSHLINPSVSLVLTENKLTPAMVAAIGTDGNAAAQVAKKLIFPKVTYFVESYGGYPSRWTVVNPAGSQHGSNGYNTYQLCIAAAASVVNKGAGTPFGGNQLNRDRANTFLCANGFHWVFNGEGCPVKKTKMNSVATMLAATTPATIIRPADVGVRYSLEEMYHVGSVAEIGATAISYAAHDLQGHLSFDGAGTFWTRGNTTEFENLQGKRSLFLSSYTVRLPQPETFFPINRLSTYTKGNWRGSA